MIDYDVKNRLVDQFKSKHNFVSILESFVDKSLDETLSDLLEKRSVDTANGFSLDIIGNIVGIERPFLPVNQDNTFGFEEDSLSGTFGDVNDTSTGSFLNTLTPKPVNRVDDDIYRQLIKAKIFINNSTSTVDSTITILNSIIDADIRYLCAKSLEPIYEINSNPKQYERDIIKSISTTLGVHVDYVCNNKDNSFGFVEDFTADTFGDANNLNIGGNLPFLL